MATVRITHIDGKLPNLALMKIAAEHKRRGDEIGYVMPAPDDGPGRRIPRTTDVERQMFEPRRYDVAYASAIFAYERSLARVETFRQQFPEAVIGGTHDATNPVTVEEALGVEEASAIDYSIYPDFYASIGFTQRGCRLKCGFCVVPKKEGKNRSVKTIAEIWRGKRTPEWFAAEIKHVDELRRFEKIERAPDLAPYHPKHLHLLDNDFFGQPRDQWEARLDEIRAGGFKVCLNQGINVRMIDDESAKALASIPYFDDSFTNRRIYTAWDNIGDEERFFRGVDTLERHDIPAEHVMAYMLIGYDKRETWERVLHRFVKMTERGIKPYPMVFGNRWRRLPLGGCNLRIGHRTLADFQRWAVRRYYTVTDFENFDEATARRAPQPDLFEGAA